MKLHEIHLDNIASPSFEAAWEKFEAEARAYATRMYQDIERALIRAAERDLGRYPTPEDVVALGTCAVHPDGRQEWNWAGRTFAVLHPWCGGQRRDMNAMKLHNPSDIIGRRVRIFTGPDQIDRGVRNVRATAFGVGAITETGSDVIDLKLAERPVFYVEELP